MNLLDKTASNPVCKLGYVVNSFKKALQLVQSVSGFDNIKDVILLGFRAYFSVLSYVAMIWKMVLENNTPVIKKVC